MGVAAPPPPQPSSLTVFCPCERAAGQSGEASWPGDVMGEAAGVRGRMGTCLGTGSSEASRRVWDLAGPGA